MFDKLFRSRAVVQRHLSSPLLQERLEYLQHCANQGYSLTTLRELAADLLLIQNLLGLATSSDSLGHIASITLVPESRLSLMKDVDWPKHPVSHYLHFPWMEPQSPSTGKEPVFPVQFPSHDPLDGVARGDQQMANLVCHGNT